MYLRPFIFQYNISYDCVIGTSERGENVATVQLPKHFKHLLIVFGGVDGLEKAINMDKDLKVKNPEAIFDFWLNTVKSMNELLGRCLTQADRCIRLLTPFSFFNAIWLPPADSSL